MEYILLGLGFFFLVKGADILVEGSGSIAKKIGIPSFVVGLTLVALGTSAPEVSVSLTSALNQANGITIGNVLGSNIFNLLVVMGVTAFFSPLPIDNTLLKIGLPFLLFSTTVMSLFGFNQNFTRIEGVTLLSILIIYLIFLIVSQVKLKEEIEDEKEEMMGWGKSIISSVLGLIAVLLGGELVVNNATQLAMNWGWSETLIGLTIVAIGTSLPELVTSVMSIKKGDSGLAIGNVVGSNILNNLFVLGLSCAISPISLIGKTVIDLGLITIFTGIATLFMLSKKSVGRWEGLTLVIIYIGYTTFLLLYS